MTPLMPMSPVTKGNQPAAPTMIIHGSAGWGEGGRCVAFDSTGVPARTARKTAEDRSRTASKNKSSSRPAEASLGSNPEASSPRCSLYDPRSASKPRLLCPTNVYFGQECLKLVRTPLHKPEPSAIILAAALPLRISRKQDSARNELGKDPD